MSQKIRIGVIFGGRSGEHEVSLQSSRSILANLSPEKYEVTEIGISKQGAWYAGEGTLEAMLIGKTRGLTPVLLRPEPGHNCLYAIREDRLEEFAHLDVVFPVLHGTFGEDGTMQGLFELVGIAYVGAGVLGSSVGMDKDLFKVIMQACGIPVLKSRLITRRAIESHIDSVIQEMEGISPYPIFTKPANLGSSVGITKCRSRADLYEGLLEAARFDRRILVEQGIDAPREIEVSVLGNGDDVEVAIPGEIVPGDDFYSYSAKYSSDSSYPVIPAELPGELIASIRQMAAKAYMAIDCAGLARVDFLLDRQTNEVFISEINTLPGFTRISMYPKMWEASGLPYPKLIDRLVELALQRHEEREHTEFSYRRGE